MPEKKDLNVLKLNARVITFNYEKTRTLESLFEQRKTKQQETLSNKINKTKETFSFSIPSELEKQKWMNDLTNSEVHNFNIVVTKENNTFWFERNGSWKNLETNKKTTIHTKKLKLTYDRETKIHGYTEKIADLHFAAGKRTFERLNKEMKKAHTCYLQRIQWLT